MHVPLKTRASFATSLDGKCGLSDCLAFYFMRRVELVDLVGGSGWGTVFLLLFAATA